MTTRPVIRDIAQVIDAMLAALNRSAVPMLDRDWIEGQLLNVKASSGFTAPELMGARWGELTDVFNACIFGTTDSARWCREGAPEWAREAGEILAGERQ